jgi:hypothetical protein
MQVGAKRLGTAQPRSASFVPRSLGQAQDMRTAGAGHLPDDPNELLAAETGYRIIAPPQPRLRHTNEGCIVIRHPWWTLGLGKTGSCSTAHQCVARPHQESVCGIVLALLRLLSGNGARFCIVHMDMAAFDTVGYSSATLKLPYRMRGYERRSTLPAR